MDGIPGLAVGSLDGDRVVCGGGWVGGARVYEEVHEEGRQSTYIQDMQAKEDYMARLWHDNISALYSKYQYKRAVTCMLQN